MSNRRQFLTRLIIGAVGATGLGSFFLSNKNQPLIAQPSPAQPTPQPIATPYRPVRIATLSDLNGPYGTIAYRKEVRRAVDLIVQTKPDLVLCGGDMVAGQKRSLTRSQLDAMWESFDRVIATPLRNVGIPFLFTLGNHDASNSRDRQGNFNFLSDRQAAAAYWNRHDNGHSSPRLKWINRDHYPFFWTAQFDDIFLMSWDASGFRLLSEHQQLAWEALKSPVARQASHRIVLGHLPLFVIAKGRNTAGAILANPGQILRQLQEHDVDLYISGHHHAYFLGRSQNMDLLHLGNAGDGSRAWLNWGRSPEQTLTWMTVPQSGDSIAYKTISLKTGKGIPLDTLPDEITGFDWRTIRRYS